MIEGGLMPISWENRRHKLLARRNFLQITAGFVAATCCAQTLACSRNHNSAAGNQPVDSVVHPAIARPHGAVYIPARAICGESHF
jgi:hypothetical protein